MHIRIPLKPIAGPVLALIAATQLLSACAPLSAETPRADDIEIAASPEAEGVAQAVAAARLADFGRRRAEPGPLIMAARMLNEIPMRAGEGGDGDAAFLSAERLLAEAETLGSSHPAVLQAIARVRDAKGRDAADPETETDTGRGVRSSPFGHGPIFMVREIKARETWGFELEARGGEVLRVAAIGDGDTDIDLLVRDAAGSTVCRDGQGDHYPVCTVVRRQAGKMRIEIMNRGSVWTKVQVLSN